MIVRNVPQMSFIAAPMFLVSKEATTIVTRGGPMDMRAGTERLLARVVQVFGAAQAHHGYLFANARATRIKLLVHDGFGVWCASRRLNAGSFVWPGTGHLGAAPLALTQAQFDALVLGLPWQQLEQMRAITRM
jgi:transposase